MGSQEVYKFMKSNKRYMTVRQVARGTKSTLVSANRILNKLHDQKMVNKSTKRIQVKPNKERRRCNVFRIK